MTSSRKGALEWEYLAAFILVLIILVLLLLFSTEMRDTILARTKDLLQKLVQGTGLR